MATRTVKARVELDGEKQYKQALSELNQGNKVLASEMRKLQAEYKGNAESTEFLTKKGDLLQRQLQQQQDKVAKLKEALQASAEKYGEADKRTQDWIIKLNNAEAAQYELEHAIEENNEALNGQNEEMTGLGDTVDGLASKFGVKLPDGAKKALNGMQGLSSGTVAAMAAAAAAVAAVIKVVGDLQKMTLEAAADVDELLSESMTTGLSTRTLQELQYAENLIDVSVNTITGSLTKLTRNMANANSGNEAMAESFAKLGVSITDSVDGSLRPAEEVFYDLIDALGQIPNETERDAVAMELFGKSAQELNPLIIQGSGALKEYAQEAENLGYILTDDELTALSEVDDAYQRMNLTIETAKKQIAAEFAPASKEAMELFANVVLGAAKALQESGIVESLGSIIRSLISIIKNIGDLIAGSPALNQTLQAITITMKGLAVLVATVADAFQILATIVNPSEWGQGNIKTALGWNRNNGELSNTQRALGYGDTTGQWLNPETGRWEGNYGHNATGNDNWRGGLTWVGESGAELVNLPRGSQIINAQDASSFGDTFYITIDASTVTEFNDIIEMARSARVRSRMRG